MTKVISTCLYGGNPNYILGTIDLIRTVREVYPGWQVWVYVAPDYIAPPMDGARIIRTTAPNLMAARFAACLEADAAAFRDADCRLEQADYLNLEQWLQGGHDVHQYGSQRRGGLWACRRRTSIPSLLVEARHGADELVARAFDGSVLVDPPIQSLYVKRVHNIPSVMIGIDFDFADKATLAVGDLSIDTSGYPFNWAIIVDGEGSFVNGLARGPIVPRRWLITREGQEILEREGWEKAWRSHRVYQAHAGGVKNLLDAALAETRAKQRSQNGSLLATQPAQQQIVPLLDENQWPSYIRVIGALRSTSDRGIGDTIERLLSKLGADRMKRIYKKVFGEDCGCDGRRDRLNIRFPYA